MKSRILLLSLFALIHLLSSVVIFGKDLPGDTDDRSNYDVKFYFLNLHVSDTSTYIKGSATIIVQALSDPLEEVTLDFSGLLECDSVLINGQYTSYIRSGDLLIVKLPQPAVGNEKLEIVIYYNGLGSRYKNLSGIYNKNVFRWNNQVTWTLSEPFSAYNWFPCKQSLTDKADSVYVFLTTDNKLTATSNGVLTNIVRLPDSRVRYEWKSGYPIAYYLISFAVSDYAEYNFYVRSTTGNDSLLIQNYIYNSPNFLHQKKSDIDITADLIRLYEEVFGPYPFMDEKYGHVTAPMGGGMEHQTLTTLYDFSFLLVAHEMAHQWFGDYVTCSSWQDIWINEGFATYAEYIASQHLLNDEKAQEWIHDVHKMVKSFPDGSVYIPQKSINDEDRIFDYRLTYMKGAAIIHMIRQEIGNDSIFYHMLRSYLEKYKNSNASGNDFRDHLATVTGKDFTLFFDQWYYGEGFPKHLINWRHENDTVYIESLQTTSSKTPFFNVILDFRFSVNQKDTIISMRQTRNFSNWKIPLKGNVDLLEVDPDNWLLMELEGIYNHTKPPAGRAVKITTNASGSKVYISREKKDINPVIYISDSDGRVIVEKEIKKRKETFTLSDISNGTYVVVVRNDNILSRETFKRK